MKKEIKKGNLNYDQSGRAYPDNPEVKENWNCIWENDGKYYELVGDNEHKEWEEVSLENEDREIHFCDVLSGITESLTEAKCCNGDISDVGNEVGYAVGKMIENMTQTEIDDFISGFLHGVSLTNGTH